MSVEEYVNQLEETGEYTIYYDYENKPDYAINNTTNEMIIFSYGYSFHAEAKSMDDFNDIDINDNNSKKLIFEELDRRLENAIDEYNKCLAHYTRTSSENNSIALSKAKAVYKTLCDLREEFIDEIYW